MTAIIDAIMEFWDWLLRVLGLRRRAPLGVPPETLPEGRARGLARRAPALILLGLALWLGALIWNFGWLRAGDLSYPQAVLAATGAPAGVAPGAGTGDAADAAEPADAGASGAARVCAPSRAVAMQAALIDMMVNQDVWAPASPLYKAGVFWLIDWEDTPWFDNKAAFQLGALDVLRAFAIELRDSLGRVRGTSAPHQDLIGAQSRLQISERAWVLNSPLDRDNALVATTTAAGSYRGAIRSYLRYNQALADCAAVYDARADNLRVVIDRMSKLLGGITDQLSKRSRGTVYDPRLDRFVPGPGNNRGWFDFRADNLFHRARGQMFALHGLMQALREDFAQVVERRDLAELWDRLEAHVAEAAALEPLIVSNGRSDGLMMPNHLAAMAEAIYRARANMVELRDVIDR
ncbi:DUF2333 family protein [Oceanicella actignis]|uniref:DUF2333 family protein n=1 Tax=Oceanicella actignis TaxID=1189325 RepID=A0A1M7RZF9_9RHOB|nr:DUF2333 family protein [Oceanicella actignis]SES95240.1 hypothetical protein SAMN04488119_102180 [Oceanicella actignis]SHN51546.1 hypothetical protein SAMN05216200_101338 [Oceanicella actignis]